MRPKSLDARKARTIASRRRVVGAQCVPARHELGEFGTISQIPVAPPSEVRQLLQQALLDHLDGEQRNQTDQGAHAQRRRFTVGLQEPVVEEIVAVVPQAQAGAAEIGHRAADIRKCSKNLVAMS